MLAYKFLSAGALGLFSGFRWPPPTNGEPGDWVAVDGPLDAGLNGIHACTVSQLPYWVNDELWRIELEGEVVDADRVLVAERGRLLARIDGWSTGSASAFAEACLDRARDRSATVAGDRSSLAAGYVEDVADYLRLCREAVDETSAVAWASCAAYVSSLVAGEDVAADERAWQARWLADRLGLGT